ncbi:Uncharacterised protein [Candidatus Gugararchaeum adminiculabundum]|nr:Uncharacterised protein [Candidatus Gugararchaeum adminiculabundum]
MNCENHPDTPAIGLCVKCEKSYCANCIERVGRGYVCFDCLKEVATASIDRHTHKSLTLKIGAIAILFLLIAVYHSILSYPTMAPLLRAISTGTAGAFLSYQKSAAVAAMVSMGIALILAIQAGLLLLNKEISFWTGMLIALYSLYYYVSLIIDNAAGPQTSNLFFGVFIPAATVVLLVFAKNDITGSEEKNHN